MINYLKTNNTIAKVDAIYNFGSSTPRDQMFLAQLTSLKFNRAISQLNGTNGLVQYNDNISLAGTVNVSGVSGAASFFETATPTVQQVVNAVENRSTGNLTTHLRVGSRRFVHGKQYVPN